MIVVRMSSAGFSQIMFNLFQNAADAVRDCRSGLITLWAEADSDAAFVRVGVTDNGSGMSEEVKRRCLEPFFTTKTRGISTGLGLSLVHSLAERAGGTTEIDSTPGVGTTFVLRLPAVVTTSQAKEPPAGACRG
jgi:signal transduction histidine kinase